MEKEIFKPIKNYETQYFVSNFGNIKSIPKDGKQIKILKQETIKSNTTNYKRVSLSKNGIVKRFQVHRLVAYAFIPNINNKPYINHINNNGENNYISNLEWCTHSENMIHAQKQRRLFESQSKGGKKAGQMQRKKAEIKYKNAINKIFGFYKILSIESIKKHPKGNVICMKCNKKYKNISIEQIISGLSIQCRTCGLKENGKKKKLKKINELEGKIVNNRKFTNVYHDGKNYRGDVTCLSCNNTYNLILSYIYRPKVYQKCRHCKK